MSPQIESFMRAAALFVGRYQDPRQQREVCALLGEQLAKALTTNNDFSRENEGKNV